MFEHIALSHVYKENLKVMWRCWSSFMVNMTRLSLLIVPGEIGKRSVARLSTDFSAKLMRWPVKLDEFYILHVAYEGFLVIVDLSKCG